LQNAGVSLKKKLFMPRMILPVAVVCIFLVMLYGCTATTVAPASTQQIIGKWTMKNAIGHYIVNGDDRRDTTNFTSADYFDFKADGTLSISETGKSYNGNWAISNSKLYITNTGYIDYTGGFDMPVATSGDLQLYYTEIKPSGTLEQWLNLYK
jgi:hypothetical protein